MANKDCPDCNDWGGNWPSMSPYNGGPWPTRARPGAPPSACVGPAVASRCSRSASRTYV